MLFLFLQQDQLAGYYQSLTLDDAKKVGLTKEELFVHCHMRSSDDRNIRSGSLHECGAKVSLWSNPKHFNCYIVEVPEKENQDVSSIMFVLSLKKRTHIFHQNTAFVKVSPLTCHIRLTFIFADTCNSTEESDNS